MAAEQLRRILLKEMGITSWFPRASLPGAALSHEQCLHVFLAEVPDLPVLPETDVKATHAVRSVADAVVEEPPVVSRPVAGSPVAQLAKLLANKPSELVIPPEVKQTPVTVDSASGVRTADNTQDEEVKAFGFSWVRVDKRLAVLAMLPPGNTRLTSNCRQMLARLLAALHAPWQSLELADQNFHWPLADDLGLPADATAARQMVDGFIARRLREQNCAMLLVLCDELPWFLLQPASTDDAAQSRVHRQFGFAMLATHSLHSMEKDAGLKREAWQAMQLLRDRLNRQT